MLDTFNATIPYEELATEVNSAPTAREIQFVPGAWYLSFIFAASQAARGLISASF